MMKKLGKYGLPLDVIYCSKCTRSNQRPHNVGEFNQTSQDKKKYVILDKKNHICEACKFYEYKKKQTGKKEIENLESYATNTEKKMEILM